VRVASRVSGDRKFRSRRWSARALVRPCGLELKRSRRPFAQYEPGRLAAAAKRKAGRDQLVRSETRLAIRPRSSESTLAGRTSQHDRQGRGRRRAGVPHERGGRTRGGIARCVSRLPDGAPPGAERAARAAGCREGRRIDGAPRGSIAIQPCVDDVSLRTRRRAAGRTASSTISRPVRVQDRELVGVDDPGVKTRSGTGRRDLERSRVATLHDRCRETAQDRLVRWGECRRAGPRLAVRRRSRRAFFSEPRRLRPTTPCSARARTSSRPTACRARLQPVAVCTARIWRRDTTRAEASASSDPAGENASPAD